MRSSNGLLGNGVEKYIDVITTRVQFLRLYARVYIIIYQLRNLELSSPVIIRQKDGKRTLPNLEPGGGCADAPVTAGNDSRSILESLLYSSIFVLYSMFIGNIYRPLDFFFFFHYLRVWGWLMDYVRGSVTYRSNCVSIKGKKKGNNNNPYLKWASLRDTRYFTPHKTISCSCTRSSYLKNYRTGGAEYRFQTVLQQKKKTLWIIMVSLLPLLTIIADKLLL